jgi:hypothetical protein
MTGCAARRHGAVPPARILYLAAGMEHHAPVPCALRLAPSDPDLHGARSAIGSSGLRRGPGLRLQPTRSGEPSPGRRWQAAADRNCAGLTRRTALEAAGVEFIVVNGVGPGCGCGRRRNKPPSGASFISDLFLHDIPVTAGLLCRNSRSLLTRRGLPNPRAAALFAYPCWVRSSYSATTTRNPTRCLIRPRPSRWMRT